MLRTWRKESSRWRNITHKHKPDFGIIDCNTFFGSRPKGGSSLSAKDLVSDLSAHGVERAISLSLQGVYYDYSQGNGETLRNCQELPFIIPAATIDPRKFYGKKSEVLDLHEFKILRIFPDLQGWPINYAPFHKIIEKASSESLPIMTSACGPGKSTEIVRAVETLNIPLILTSVNYSTLSEVMVLLDQYEGLYIGIDMLNTPDGIELISREVGPGRLVFGSNYPLAYFSGPLIAVEKSEIPPSYKRKILRENILQILGIR